MGRVAGAADTASVTENRDELTAETRLRGERLDSGVTRSGVTVLLG